MAVCGDRPTCPLLHSRHENPGTHGLRSVARKVRVSLTHKGKAQPIEDADWDKIIIGIQNTVRTAHQLTHGPHRAAHLKIYSDVAERCLCLRELRNEVSHTRKSYDELEALGRIRQVRAFMLLVASGLPKSA